MNPFERQDEILNDISQILFAAADGEYDEVGIEVELNDEENLFKFNVWQTVDSVKTSLPQFSGKEGPALLNLSLALQKEIMNHTGGDMKKFVLRISGAGRACVDYEYREPPVKQDTPY